MRIRHFTAPTMAEALAEVRAVLGDEAVILSSEPTRGGTVVRAASTAPELPEHPVMAEIANDPGRSFAERMLATLSLAEEETHAPAPAPKTPGQLAHTLSFHGVADDLVAKLVAKAAGHEAEGDVIALARALDTAIGFTPLEVAQPRPVMLVGLPGSGKSSVAARLAVRAVLSGKQVQLIAAGPARAGARAQLETYGNLIRTPVLTADDENALKAICRDAAPASLRIIDTAGINPFSAEERASLAALAKAADAEPVLVTPSNCADLEDHAALFASLGAERMIVTRLDCARRHGAALNAAHRLNLKLSHAAQSPFIGDAMTPLNPFTLARLLLELPISAG
ncbi:MAG TPA: hypothetical protein PL096_07060 [Micropepsaceae bacterium]|nr:hypothetical protein [Micropepsaceae bacterium]